MGAALRGRKTTIGEFRKAGRLLRMRILSLEQRKKSV